MKQVPDPEAPSSSFQVDPEAKRILPSKGTPPVLNPFDENALEAALRMKGPGEIKAGPALVLLRKKFVKHYIGIQLVNHIQI